MKPVLKVLFFVLLPLAVLIGIGTTLFIGFGALLSRWLPLSLFHASALAIGTTLAMAAVIYALAAIMHAHHAYDLDDDFEDEEDDLDSNVPEIDTFFPDPDLSKVGRNARCPCGSGKKFKTCCEKTTVK